MERERVLLEGTAETRWTTSPIAEKKRLIRWKTSISSLKAVWTQELEAQRNYYGKGSLKNAFICFNFWHTHYNLRALHFSKQIQRTTRKYKATLILTQSMFRLDVHLLSSTMLLNYQSNLPLATSLQHIVQSHR